MKYALISWWRWFKPETISYGFHRNNFLETIFCRWIYNGRVLPSWKFRRNHDFSSRVISIWNMPLYRDDIDLNQKQLVTVSIARNFLETIFCRWIYNGRVLLCWKFRRNHDFSCRVISIWNMPWYCQDFDLNQKQLVTVSIATTSRRRFFATSFIMVECFNPENFVKIVILVLNSELKNWN